VGPCRSAIEVRRIEDVRAARRREVVERAKTLLTEAFDDSVRSSRDLVEEVREAVRVEDVTAHEGLPAGPNVADSDAIVVVEGRADVLTLLRYGIKNAVAVEGTDVPDAVADLSRERTVTAFLDGDRGGELILKELAQVGSVDHVAFASEGRSVEDLARREVMAALREKVPYESVGDVDSPGEVAAPDHTGGQVDGTPATTGGSDGPADEAATAPDQPESGADAGARSREAPADEAATAPDQPESGADAGARSREAPADGGSTGGVATGPEGAPDSVGDGAGSDAAGDAAAPADVTGESPPRAGERDRDDGEAVEAAEAVDAPETVEADEAVETVDADDVDSGTATTGEATDPETLPGHVRAVVGGDTGRVRLLDEAFGSIRSGDAEEAFALVEEADEPPAAVVLDGALDQRLLDVAAQRGVGQVVAARTGEFVKQPTSVRVRTAEDLLAANEA
jgi:5S rRNA maturation endonuclease (ribonuclease M5)